MASQRVHAPASTVWERILDFSMWPKVVNARVRLDLGLGLDPNPNSNPNPNPNPMWPKVVDNVVSARVYSAEQRPGGEHLKVEVVIGVTLLRIRTFVHHIYRAG